MLILGLILFVFLLILFWRVVIWFVGTIGAAKGLEEEYRKYTRFFGIFIAVATVLFFIGDEIYTNMQFKQLCKKEAGLKIYKTVSGVDGFLHMSDDYNGFLDKFGSFNYIERLDGSINKSSSYYNYYLEDFSIKGKDKQYKINQFLFYTREKQFSKSEIESEEKLDFNKFSSKTNIYKIHHIDDRHHDFELSDKNASMPKSKYIYLGVSLKTKHDFLIKKSAIIDKTDYSVLAEKKNAINYGGKFTHIVSWLIAGYRSPISKGSCGSKITASEFTRNILQSTTVLERN